MRGLGAFARAMRRAATRASVQLVPKPPRRARAAFVPEAEYADGLRADAGRIPVRPSLPPVFGCALGLWATCAAVVEAARLLSASACAAIGAVGLVVSLACLALVWRRRGALAGVVVLGCALGVCCGGWHAAVQHGFEERVQGLSTRASFQAVADGSAGMFGSTCLARATVEGGESFLVRVQLPQGEEVLQYGQAFEAQASFSAPSDSSAAYCWRNGAVASARIFGLERVDRGGPMGALVDLRSRAIGLLADRGGSESGVLAALVCGWRGHLPESTYQAFKVAGLAHVVAVSGAHLSIVSAFCCATLRALRVPRAVTGVVQAALLLSYLVLTAAPSSAVRAAVMAFAGMASFAVGRRPAALSALAVCIVGFASLDPRVALSVSFALSALSTLGIVLFASLFSAWIAHAAPRIPRFACEALSLTFASAVLATPLSTALFSQFSLVAPLANVVTAPLFAPACALGLLCVGAATMAPGAASALLDVACAGSYALTAAVEALARIPYASAPASVSVLAALAVSIALAAALWIAWPRPTRRIVLGGAACVAFAAACFLVAPPAGSDSIVMLDVGQGDAIVVRSRGSAVLVDTGNQDARLFEALARQGLSRLDAVVVTHGDDDHKGSLSSLAGVVRTERVFVAQDALACPCDACRSLREDAVAVAGEDGVCGLALGDSVRVGSIDLQVVWPRRFEDEGGNADSLCPKALADVDGDGSTDWTALLVGDAERDQVKELLDTGAAEGVDIYKVGHHGSKNALDEQVAFALSPKISLVSAGAGNRYGHPAAKTLEILENAGSRVLRTDESGDVSCKLEPDRIVVETLR